MGDRGFLRAALLTPGLKVAAIEENLKAIDFAINNIPEERVGLIVLPELCLTGKTAGDLFFQEFFYDKQLDALNNLINMTKRNPSVLVFGFYFRHSGRLFNCAGLAKGGTLIGIVPKLYPAKPELRWFSPGNLPGLPEKVNLSGHPVPFGQLLFTDTISELSFSIRPGDDLFTPMGVQNPGLIVVCPSASEEQLGKTDLRRHACKNLSRINHGACCYVSSGPGESTGRSVYSGHRIVTERGRLLAEDKALSGSSEMLLADIDFGSLNYRRSRPDASPLPVPPSDLVVELSPVYTLPDDHILLRKYQQMSFIPSDPETAASNFSQAFEIQKIALATKLERANNAKAVIGISGGLDSTLALLVCSEALKLSKRNPKDLITITMPGFGTSERPYNNAVEMANLLSADLREISIVDSVNQHFKDIGHDPALQDLVFENAQARERTQILMDIANKENGIVIGTGDLSEAALGFSTYNADQMAMYNINANLPKTFIAKLLSWITEGMINGDSKASPFSTDDYRLGEILADVVQTPISPELLPPDKDGSIIQKTEDKVGPYVLHDFFLYHIINDGWPPERLFKIACQTFKGLYEKEKIADCLKLFYTRFISQQFKRTAVPDSPNVGTLDLSPIDGFVLACDIDPTSLIY